MKTKLFFLAILFSFIFSNVKAQCPEGDVTLESQTEVNSFFAIYPNCTHITGKLTIGHYLAGPYNGINDVSGFINLNKVDGDLRIGHTDLVNLDGFNNVTEVGGLSLTINRYLSSISELLNLTKINGRVQLGMNTVLESFHGLNNIQEIEGFLRISQNENTHSFSGLNNLKIIRGSFDFGGTHVNSLEGLEKLEYIGDFFVIYNTSLANLEVLNNLNYVGGRINISENPNLTSLMGIHNFTLALEGETDGVYLINNSSLTQCNLPNICDYLELNSTEYPREIIGNTGNCTDEQAVLAACGLGISDMENNSANWNVHYQKNTGEFLIQTNGFKISEIEVYDLSGKLLKSVHNLNSDREDIRVFTPETILIIKVKTQEGKSFAKKVMMK